MIPARSVAQHAAAIDALADALADGAELPDAAAQCGIDLDDAEQLLDDMKWGLGPQAMEDAA